MTKQICEGCFAAYQDIAGDSDSDALTLEVAEEFMSAMGADVPDHICDTWENGGVACPCSCHPQG